MEKRVLTTREAAAYIGVSYSYLRAIRNAGPVKGRVTPPPMILFDENSEKTARYLKEDLDKWLNSRKKRFALEENPTSEEFSDER